MIDLLYFKNVDLVFEDGYYWVYGILIELVNKRG